ncbi:MAG: V-type ATP synthase subunit I [Candidatus Aminicenantes bacterium]|nr:V-type ATP synthase subunit I [Candidatus Aminicenantes bacterium]
MGVSKVQKVEIVAHSGVKKALLSSLQEEGVVHIEQTQTEELGLTGSSADVTDLDHRLHRLKHVLDYLANYKDEKLLKRLFGQKPQVSRSERTDVLKLDYMSLLDRIKQNESDKNNLNSHLKYLEREEEWLEPLSDLEIPIKSIRSTDSTRVLLGFLTLAQMADIESLADQGALWYSIIQKGKRYVYLLLVYLKSESAFFEESLRELDFHPVYFTDPVLERAEESDRVEDVLVKIAREEERTQKEIEDLDNEAKRLCTHREELMQVHDVLMNEREKELSSRMMGETERVSYMEGWVLTKDKERLLAKLEPYAENIECYFRDALPEEDPPVDLQNPKADQPFELITKLYSLPKSGTLDPTPYLTPFFFIFVGLTVSEAGYGFLVTLFSLLLLKFAKPKGNFRKFIILMAILGVSNIFIGTMVGGWFGFPIRRLMVLDPLQNPVPFLLLSLALGFVQVWFGTLLNMISKIRSKEYLQAIFVQGGWLLLLPSLVAYGVTKNSVAGILTLVGAGGIVLFGAPSRNPIARFFGGLYSLYDISRYLADILSYSRLLALGLATSVIAMVVNTLCKTALDIPKVGWLVAALIFVGGHLYNLAISFLGGFVHSMRLQFVEFFSKFFISGGRPFKPLELESKYVEFI